MVEGARSNKIPPPSSSSSSSSFTFLSQCEPAGERRRDHGGGFFFAHCLGFPNRCCCRNSSEKKGEIYGKWRCVMPPKRKEWTNGWLVGKKRYFFFDFQDVHLRLPRLLSRRRGGLGNMHQGKKEIKSCFAFRAETSTNRMRLSITFLMARTTMLLCWKTWPKISVIT